MQPTIRFRFRWIALPALAAAAVACPAAAQVPAFGGSWASSPSSFQVLRSVIGENPRGWNNLLEGIAAIDTYRIEVAQEPTLVSVSFPGGPKNILTTPPMPVDGGIRSTVVDHGDRWEKFVGSATLEGRRLRLKTTRFTGWSSIDPDTVTAQATQVVTDLLLTLNPGGDALTLRMVVSDEKGEAEYEQAFRRAP